MCCCCCNQISAPKCFGGCCHGNVETEESCGQRVDSGGNGRLDESGTVAIFDRENGQIRKGIPGEAGTSWLCCPCGGGKEGRMNLKEVDGEEQHGCMGRDGEFDIVDNGGEGGHARESR